MMSHKKENAFLLYASLCSQNHVNLVKKYVDIHDINSRTIITNNKYIYIHIIFNFNLLIANISTSMPKKKFR